MALLFQTNLVSRRNIAGYVRRLLVNPRYDSGRTHPITQMRPLYKNLGPLLIEHAFKERRAEVALGGIGEYHHNRLAGEFR